MTIKLVFMDSYCEITAATLHRHWINSKYYAATINANSLVDFLVIRINSFQILIITHENSQYARFATTTGANFNISAAISVFQYFWWKFHTMRTLFVDIAFIYIHSPRRLFNRFFRLYQFSPVDKCIFENI